MRCFDQTMLSNPEKGTYGDCTRACVYTLLGEDLGLPDPIVKGAWNLQFFVKLAEHGYELGYQPVRPGKDYSFLPRIVGAGGNTVRTERTGVSHMVVYDMDAAAVVHDPHPSRAGLISIDGLYWMKRI